MLDLPQNLVSSLAKYGRKLAQDESNSREEDADVAVRTAFAEKDGERERERDVQAVRSQELLLVPALQIFRGLH